MTSNEVLAAAKHRICHKDTIYFEIYFAREALLPERTLFTPSLRGVRIRFSHYIVNSVLIDYFPKNLKYNATFPTHLHT